MKEADETEFWLFLCNELENYPNSDELLNDVFEILKITNKIITTSKNKQICQLIECLRTLAY